MLYLQYIVNITHTHYSRLCMFQFRLMRYPITATLHMRHGVSIYWPLKCLFMEFYRLATTTCQRFVFVRVICWWLADSHNSGASSYESFFYFMTILFQGYIHRVTETVIYLIWVIYHGPANNLQCNLDKANHMASRQCLMRFAHCPYKHSAIFPG